MGHSLSKHANRNPKIWGKIQGPPESWHGQAMNHFREIYRSPGTFELQKNKNGTEFIEKILHDGRGIRIQKDYKFKGFID